MEYLSIAQVAALANIPETTIRRYAAHYAKYLDSQQFGRVTKYKVPQTIVFMQRIVSLYQEGKTTEEVDTLLGLETMAGNGADSLSELAATTCLPRETFILPEEMSAVMRQQTELLQRIAAAIEQIVMAQNQKILELTDERTKLEKQAAGRGLTAPFPRAVRKHTTWRTHGGMVAGVLCVALAAVAWYHGWVHFESFFWSLLG